jgi:hypothetical protein
MGTLTTSSDIYVADPQPGTVSFWERIGKLGILGTATIGLLSVSSYLVIKGIEVPEWYIGLVLGVVGATGYTKYKASK